MRKIQTAVGILLFLLALIGCATPVDWDGPTGPTTRPADADLPGLYRPTEETLALVKKGEYASRDMSIELRADGTCQIQNIPDWWCTEFGKPAGGFDSGNGKWQLAKSQSYWGLELDFPNVQDFASLSDHRVSLTKGVNLRGQKPPYEISITIGDPDEARAMRFRKVPAAAAPD